MRAMTRGKKKKKNEEEEEEEEKKVFLFIESFLVSLTINKDMIDV
jgi:hypothetical protein